MRISDWSSDVCSSDLILAVGQRKSLGEDRGPHPAADSPCHGHHEHRAAHDEGQRRIPCAEDVEEAPHAGRIGHSGERSEEHTSELQSLMRISYAVFCLKKKNHTRQIAKLRIN